MITKREASERGKFKLDWLNARHSFSFGSYFDPNWMGFSKLRVINEDVISPKGGFDTHPHKNMEIVSFIIKGSLEHKDTLGNHSVIKPGQIQIMSAGKGVLHSEFNPSDSEETHMLQIWVEPNVLDIEPRYEQFDFEEKINELVLLAGPDKEDGIAQIYQDAKIYLGHIDALWDEAINPNKKYWLQVVEGKGLINNSSYSSGDAFALESEKQLELSTEEKTRFLLFELN